LGNALKFVPRVFEKIHPEKNPPEKYFPGGFVGDALKIFCRFFELRLPKNAKIRQKTKKMARGAQGPLPTEIRPCSYLQYARAPWTGNDLLLPA
jgi:hypothetical protein